MYHADGSIKRRGNFEKSGYRYVWTYHISLIWNWREDIIVINPGSLSYPRQKGRRASYIIMEIHEDNSVEYELQYV